MRHRGATAPPRHGAPAAEKGSLSEPRFRGSFPRADVALDPPLPEIALVGRSNVGKSSLLNAIAGRRIARVSTTPGKTQAMNVYELVLGSGERGAVPHGANRARDAYLLDLPGYGYARAGRAARAAFRRLVTQTLHRPNLHGVLWLLDVRRDPSMDDQAMLQFLTARGTPVLAAITKTDKLPWGRRGERHRTIRDALGLDVEQSIATSARTGDGIPELRDTMQRLVLAQPAGDVDRSKGTG